MISKNKHSIRKILFISPICIGLLSSLVLPSFMNLASATSLCVTARCKQAEQAEQEATKKATEATNTAMTLEGEVQRLDAEIAAIEAKISANQIVADELSAQIKKNTAELKVQRAGLAKMLVNMHFTDDINSVMLLAGSSSLSDYAEKQSRLDTVKSQITSSAQKIKTIKEKLEAQKVEVDRILQDQKNQHDAVDKKRTEQTELIAKYRFDANAFSADATAARAVRLQEEERHRQTLHQQSTGYVTNDGTDSYPYRRACLYENAGPLAIQYWIGGGYGGLKCQCTDYAGFKAYQYTNGRVRISGWGHASNWANAASNYYTVTSTPSVNTIAVSGAGAYGHVMWVEAVNSDGTIRISEYNWNPYVFSTRNGVSTAGLKFIHF